MLELRLNSAPQNNLSLKPKLGGVLALKPTLALRPNVISDEQAKEIGYQDLGNELILARGSDWIIKADTMNFILVINGKNSYYSDFENLLWKLYEHKVKFQLSKETWSSIVVSLETTREEIESVSSDMQKILLYITKKCSI